MSQQAKQSDLFDRVSRWSLRDIASIDLDFIARQSSYIEANPKGLGNYIWKPKVFLEEITQMNHGDVLVMLDSGCQLNLTQASISKFQEYVLGAIHTGGVFMQLPQGAFKIDDLSDSAWTKLSLLNYLDPKSIFRDSGQVQAGIIIVQKTPEVVDFADKWMDICQLDNNFYLSEPDPTEEQLERFHAHRWEQSVMSLLVKQSGFTLIQDETYFAPEWGLGADYPIWAMRNRSGGDAYRRNLSDLVKISVARIKRRF